MGGHQHAVRSPQGVRNMRLIAEYVKSDLADVIGGEALNQSLMIYHVAARSVNKYGLRSQPRPLRAR